MNMLTNAQKHELLCEYRNERETANDDYQKSKDA